MSNRAPRRLQASSERDLESRQIDGQDDDDTGVETTVDAVLPVESGSDGQEILLALADEDCQAILDATADTALSVPELADRCDLSLSTAYRKMDTLTRIGLVEEGTRIHHEGGDVSEYTRVAGNVMVQIAQTGDIKLQLTQHTCPSYLGSVESVESD